MRLACFLPILTIGAVLLAGCSSTTIDGSWKSPDYTAKVKKVYIIGIAKKDTNRRIFEDEFDRQLAAHGVTGLSSYKDMPKSEEIDVAQITAYVKMNGADSVLMTNVTGKRTEEVVNPGRISSYGSGPDYGSRRGRGYYGNYGSYYNQRRDVVYQPATVTEFQIATVEANLYDAKTTELIWSAQLETVVDNNIEKLLTEFIETVIKDMDSKGLL
jgi:hypothetical protein